MLPAATTTDAGTLTAALLLESATVVAALAVPESVTVQVDAAFEATVDGEQVTLVTVTVAGAVTVNGALADPPFSEALTVAV